MKKRKSKAHSWIALNKLSRGHNRILQRRGLNIKRISVVYIPLYGYLTRPLLRRRNKEIALKRIWGPLWLLRDLIP